MCNGIARNQQRGGMVFEGATFPPRGAPLLSPQSHLACGARWTPVRERGAHLRHLGASLMPMIYVGGGEVQKRAPYESHGAPPSSYRGTALRA